MPRHTSSQGTCTALIHSEVDLAQTEIEVAQAVHGLGYADPTGQAGWRIITDHLEGAGQASTHPVPGALQSLRMGKRDAGFLAVPLLKDGCKRSSPTIGSLRSW